MRAGAGGAGKDLCCNLQDLLDFHREADLALDLRGLHRDLRGLQIHHCKYKVKSLIIPKVNKKETIFHTNSDVFF